MSGSLSSFSRMNHPVLGVPMMAHPTNRKWVITSVIDVDIPYLSHVNHWGYNPLTIRGMSHQVPMMNM